MKRSICILTICFIILLAVSVFIKPLIIFLARNQIRKVFPDSNVTIAHCSLKPLRKLALSDIQVSRKSLYDFKIKRIVVFYSPFSIIRRGILKASLEDASVSVNFPQHSILELRKYIVHNSARPAFAVNLLELSNLNLDVNSADVRLKAKISLGLNLVKRLIGYCDIKVDSLEMNAAQLQRGYLKVNRDADKGEVGASGFKYGKLSIKEIQGNARLKDDNLVFDSLSAGLFGGILKGDAAIKLKMSPKYQAKLTFVDLDLDRFIKDFNLKEKAEVTGRVSGSLTLQGDGENIDILNGNFASTQQGGVLTVKDTRFLQNLARNSGKSLDLVVESFRNYRYNSGVAIASLQDNNIIFNINLDGSAGKRNLDIVLHDFNLRRAP